MGDLIAFPPNRPRGPQPKQRLSDIRMVPFENQPPAITQPGEPWRLNVYHMSQLIVIRDGKQVIVGEMQTVRDAAAAVQSRAIVELLARAKEAGTLTLEHVHDIMERYGR